MKTAAFLSVLLCLAAGPALAEGWVPIGPPGGEISHLLVHPRNPQTLWAGTPLFGVFKSVDGGASWNPSNQGLDRHDVQALANAPGNPQTLYAAAGGKVYRSLDGARTWTVALSCDDEPSPCPFVSVHELVVHPSEARTVFAVTSLGVFKSVDGGARWGRVRVDTTSFIHTLVFEPGDPRTLYAAGGGQLFKSRDSGSSWALRSASRIEAINGQRLVIDPGNPRRMWMGGSTSDGVYRSTDGGAHWRRSRAGLTNFTARALALSPATGGGLPAVWIGNPAGLFRSLDGGVTWERVLRNRRVIAIATHPRQPAILWTGTQPAGRQVSGVYKSVDRGATWRFSSRGIFTVETFSLAFDPVEPGVLWAASEEGVRHSADGGATWTERSGNLPRDLFLITVATDPHDPETVWAGTTQGVFVTEDGGATWEERREGLSAPDATPPVAPVHLLRIAPSDPEVAYVASQEKLFRTDDAGRHWTLLPAPPIPATLRSGDLWVDPRDPDVLFAARGGFWVSRDGGASWSEVPLGNGAAGFRAVAADPRDPDVLYAGGDQGVFRSADGGLTWEHVTRRTAVTRLTVGITGTVWAEINRRVFFSPDGISDWDLLPGLSQYDALTVLAADPHDPGTVFAGGYALMSGNRVLGLFRHTGD